MSATAAPTMAFLILPHLLLTESASAALTGVWKSESTIPLGVLGALDLLGVMSSPLCVLGVPTGVVAALGVMRE